MAFYYNVPESAEIAKKFSDNSGKKYFFIFDKGNPDIKVGSCSDYILVDKADAYWFKEALSDMIDLIEMEVKENKPKVEAK